MPGHSSPPGDPDTLGYMSNPANSYADLGRHSDAVKLREETLALCKGTLGADHPRTFYSMKDLAESLLAVHRGPRRLPSSARRPRFGRNSNAPTRAACITPPASVPSPSVRPTRPPPRPKRPTPTACHNARSDRDLMRIFERTLPQQSSLVKPPSAEAPQWHSREMGRPARGNRVGTF